MKNYIKFVLAVVVFTTSFVFTNQKVYAKGLKGSTETLCCAPGDGICGRTAEGNILYGICCHSN